jgi:hypothetical protein
MSSPLKADRGLLVAFEGLDQSGKQTQAELLRDRLTSSGRLVRLLSFPDYQTVIGAEIGRALRGEREYTADVMQLLYVANRYEFKGEICARRRAARSSCAIAISRRASPTARRRARRRVADGHPEVPAAARHHSSARTSRRGLGAAEDADRDKYERDLSMSGAFATAIYGRRRSQAGCG